MFAHQVLEQIEMQASHIKRTKRNELPDDQGGHYFRLIVELPDVIRSSFKFHIESYKKTRETFQHLAGSRLFFDNSEFIKMPYDMIWLDYIVDEFGNPSPDEVSVSKRAILAIKADNYDDVLFMYSFHKYNEWILSPVAYRIIIGRHAYDGSGNIKPIQLADIPDFNVQKAIDDDVVDMNTLSNFLMLINCKNIKGVTVPAPERLNRKRLAKGRVPIFTYKVLNVVIPKSKSKSNPTSSGETVRLHFCRGHFKMYTKDKPLFGKHVGLYWWQPHVRGDAGKGFVEKDYNVAVE